MRHFGKELVRDLVMPHIRRRLHMSCIQYSVRVKAQCYLGGVIGALPEDQPRVEVDPLGDLAQEPGQDTLLIFDAAAETEPKTKPRKTRRCHACIARAPNHRASNNLKKVGTSCRFCNKATCVEHLLLSCVPCGDGTTLPDPLQPSAARPFHYRRLLPQPVAAVAKGVKVILPQLQPATRSQLTPQLLQQV